MAAMDAQRFGALPPEAMAGFQPDQMRELPPELMGGFDADRVRTLLRSNGWHGCSAIWSSATRGDGRFQGDQFANLPPAAMAAFDAEVSACLQMHGGFRQTSEELPVDLMGDFLQSWEFAA